LQWEEIKKAESKEQSFCAALGKIINISNDDKISSDQDPFTQDYYSKTKNPEEYFSQALLPDENVQMRYQRAGRKPLANTSLFTPTTTTTSTATEKPPKLLCCHLTGILMKDPVFLTVNGHTYERENILSLTNQINFTKDDLIENRGIKEAIQEWRQKNLPEDPSYRP